MSHSCPRTTFTFPQKKSHTYETRAQSAVQSCNVRQENKIPAAVPTSTEQQEPCQASLSELHSPVYGYRIEKTGKNMHDHITFVSWVVTFFTSSGLTASGSLSCAIRSPICPDRDQATDRPGQTTRTKLYSWLRTVVFSLACFLSLASSCDVMNN